MTKDELIAALEKATGPSRELDAEISAATRLLPGFPRHEYVAPATMEAREDGTVDCYAAAPGRAPQRVERARAPQWTASIDAALALVPDGWTRAVDATAPELGVDVQLFPPADGSEVVGSHKHEALALCIAALRARP